MWFASQVENFRTLPEEVLAINVLDLGVRNFVRLASTNKVMKLILSLLSERFELRALMEHPWGVLAAQRLGINTSLLIMREAYWLRSPMLRVLIRKFGDKLKEIQISPERGIHYVNLLRTDYLLRYGGAGVLEFFEWGGRITVRPVVRF